MKIKNCLLTIMMAVLCLSSMPAQASLFIAPLRAVFEGKTRTKTISLLNRSNETNTYRMEFIEKKMLDDGSYGEVEGIPDFAASPYLRVSPKQVTLKPGERQSVRISYRRPADLAPREYHSHLLFKLLPKSDLTDNNKDRGMSVKINVELSFAVPVFIRHEVDELSTELSNFSIIKGDNGKPAISLTVTRSGDLSPYGRFMIYNEEKEVVGRLNNVSLFSEIKSRTYTVPLRDGALQAKELYITYEGAEEYRNQVWDQKTLKLK